LARYLLILLYKSSGRNLREYRPEAHTLADHTGTAFFKTSGDILNRSYDMSDPGPFEMEEGDHVPLTYAGLKRWLGLVLLVILAASLAWVLKPILLLFAIVILLAMVLNPIPFVFGQAMDLNPVSILFFTLAMSSLFGLTGAILAVPAAAMFKIAIEEFYFHRLQLNEDQIAAQAKQIIYGRGDPEKGG
jgi:hypothetical protein